MRLRNISGEPLYVGRADGRRVDRDEVLTLDGDATETPDAYIVGEGADARAYPKSLWRDASTPKKPAAPAREEQ